MIELDFNLILKRIINEGGLSEKEAMARINKKIEELSGLVSNKGAAHIVATELGIKLTPVITKQFITLDKVMPGLSNITIIGRISEIFKIKDFDKKGKKGKVGSLSLTDGLGNARLVFWNEHTNLLSSSKFGVNDIIRVHHLRSKQGFYGIELHFTNRSRVEVNPKGVEVSGKKVNSAIKLKISDLQEGFEASIRGCAVQLIKRKPLFEVCPQCNKKLDKQGGCESHSFSKPGHSTIINSVFDDGTGTISCVFFGRVAEQFIKSSADKIFEELKNKSVEEFIKIKENELLGTEMVISGRIVHNNFSDRTELIVKEFKEADPVAEAMMILKNK